MITITEALFSLADSGDEKDLEKALQAAIELEHATMPPYLYAYYSLGDSNPDIKDILRSIVIDEMTHMLLAGNLLKAIGGSPNIYRKDFIPTYPTPLPGCVATGFTVPLKRFSKQVVENVFMRIEEPEHILVFPVVEAFGGPPARTIGEFYRRIRETFKDQGDKLIKDTDGSTQPSTDFFEIEQKVTSAKRAIEAINVIVEQGEGTTEDPHVPVGDQDPNNDRSAHFYSFKQIVVGKLEPNPKATPMSPPADRYFYNAKHQIPYDDSKVLPFPDNPKAESFPEKSQERIGIDRFNRSYTKMLKRLHQAFNGTPSRLDDAIREMTGEMRESAQALQAWNLGPTFEFLQE